MGSFLIYLYTFSDCTAELKVPVLLLFMSTRKHCILFRCNDAKTFEQLSLAEKICKPER